MCLIHSIVCGYSRYVDRQNIYIARGNENSVLCLVAVVHRETVDNLIHMKIYKINMLRKCYSKYEKGNIIQYIHIFATSRALNVFGKICGNLMLLF